MSNSNISLNAILWLKSELDKTLLDARSALDYYAEDAQQLKHGKQALSHYKMAHGVLKVARIRGGEVLLEEVIAVLVELLAGRLKRRNDAIETIMRATVQLPDYLEYLQAGNADVPLVLLPLLNDLRATRDAPLLSDGLLDLTKMDQDQRFFASRKSSGESVKQLVGGLRSVFQRSLLEWYQGRNSVNNLLKMAAIFFRLGNASKGLNSQRLWLVSQAVVEAIQSNDLESSIAVKSLLGRVDRQMKHLIDVSEEEFERDVPGELIQNLLFYVAAANSGVKTVDTVKALYKLDRLLPDGSSIEKARANLRGANSAIGSSLTQAVIDDVNDVKERLEVYAFADKPSSDILFPVAAKLNDLADTAKMLSLDSEQRQLRQASERLQAALQAESVLTREELQDIARVLVDTEIAVKSFSSRTPDDGESQSEKEYRKVYHAVVQESLSELGKVRAAMLEYLERYNKPELLQPIPALLRNIQGASSILPMPVVDPLLTKLIEYISTIIKNGSTPDEDQLAAFADGVSSIEFYLESLEPGIGDQKNILAIGERSLARLDPFIDAEVKAAPVAPQPPPREPSAESDDRDDDLVTMIEMDAVELARTETEIEVDPVEMMQAPEEFKAQAIAEDSDDDALAGGFENDTPLMVSTGDVEMMDDLLSDLVVLPDAVDREILEIFLEEADEEAQKIRENLGQWRGNPDEQEALITMRRSFHTLKGSGRLIGAGVIAEFAWKFEGLLNRVIDGSLKPTAEVLSTLDTASGLLPQLVEQIETRSRPDREVGIAMQYADVLAGGGSLDELSMTQMQAPGDITVIIDPDDESEPGEQQRDEIEIPEFDASPVEELEPNIAPASSQAPADAPEPDDELDLRSVLLHEVEEQLDLIDARLETARENDQPLDLDDELLRAVQTINNVSRTAEVPQIYTIFSRAERFLEHCKVEQKQPGDDFTQALTDASVDLRQILGDIERKETLDDPDLTLTGRFERMLALADSDEDASRDETEEVLKDTLQAPTLLYLDGAGGEAETEEEALRDITEELVPEHGFEEEPEDEALYKTAIEEQESLKVSTFEAADTTAEPDIISAKDSDLIGVFIEEAREILDTSETLMSEWHDARSDNIVVKELQRHLHTLKGGSRMAGLDNLGNLSHALESLFDAVVANQVPVSESVLHLARSSFDAIGRMVNTAEQGQPVFPARGLLLDIEETLNPKDAVGKDPEATSSVPPQTQPAPNVGIPTMHILDTQISDPFDDALDIAREIERGNQQEAPSEPVTEQTPILGVEPPEFLEEAATATAEPEPADEPESPVVAKTATDDRPGRRESIKVNPMLLDELVNQAGEINIFHARVDEQIKQTHGRLQELRETIDRLHEQLRRMEAEAESQILATFNRDEKFDPEVDVDSDEFDPLELDRYSQIQQLSRSLAESISDLVSLEEMVGSSLGEIETLLQQKSRVSTDLQEGLMRTRLVPFSIQLPRLQRITRQTAEELNKEVQLVITGENNELDRKLLESMIAPLEHLIRNAISHGIESPDLRIAAGKEQRGTIEISIQRNGPEIELVVSDDGAGIDTSEVREKAIKRGLIEPGEELDDDEMLQFILQSGFSTAKSVTKISGRGVGLDVVNTEIKKLNGDLRIASQRGKGTSFRISLPFTLAINQSLLIQSGEEIFAVPVTSIYGVVRLQPEKVATQLALDEPHIDYGGTRYELRHLGSVLNQRFIQMNTSEDQLPLLLVNTGDKRVAFLADSVLGSREIVVKPIGPPLSDLIEYSGGTILGDGNVALILDMPGVVRMSSGGKASLVREKRDEVVQPMVMVVDDSITIRKVTSKILERNNYQVTTAKDGMDALQRLNEQVPDLMLLDVEMPRMDGFELATRIRQTEELSQLPIVMITSRTGKKHKERAAQIGVNRYLGKPFQEDELLAEIRLLLSPGDAR